MITYDYYRIFYFVARYKSFTKAAKMLGNNQPNITRCMNILEQELKCTLFLRSNRGISLTPEGKKLYEHVAIAYEQLQIGEEEIRQNGELENGLVSIGASENALRLVLLSRLEKFHEQYSVVTLSNRSGAIKKDGTSGEFWWFRAAVSNTTDRFFSVISNGGWNAITASTSNGVSPAFRLG